VAPERASWDLPAVMTYREAALFEREAEDTDVFVLRKKRMVSVSPLSLDLTSRVDFAELDRSMRT
jgi:broad specificity polyphosphatase/5'/3'-nucleotidase SurE